MRKLFWVRADWSSSWEEIKPFISAAADAGCDVVVCRPDHIPRVMEVGTVSLATCEPSQAGWLLLQAGTVQEVVEAAKRARGEKVALRIGITSKEMERAAVEWGDKFSCLVVCTTDWKVIPLENLIANLHGKVPLLAEVRSAEEVRLVLETLELGVDGVMLDPRERGPAEIGRVAAELERSPERVELRPARVTLLRQVGLGERACLDTVVSMSVGEGMLVGSQAEGLFLVHSETLPSPFVEPRPLRVNAGAIHSYIRVPGGKTRYLSELSSGDEVLIVNVRGETRVATIGRVKLERRPLLLVEAECEGGRYRVILQNAETINLVGADGKPVSVAKLKPGDEVLLCVEKGGRHFGVKVEEAVVEK